MSGTVAKPAAVAWVVNCCVVSPSKEFVPLDVQLTSEPLLGQVVKSATPRRVGVVHRVEGRADVREARFCSTPSSGARSQNPCRPRPTTRDPPRGARRRRSRSRYPSCSSPSPSCWNPSPSRWNPSPSCSSRWSFRYRCCRLPRSCLRWARRRPGRRRPRCSSRAKTRSRHRPRRLQRFPRRSSTPESLANPSSARR